MKNKIFFSFLLVALLSACSTTKNQNLTEAIALKITGTYDGEIVIKGDVMKVSVFDVETARLSTYKNVRPLIGGNRVSLYFDTDMEGEGPEYCAFIYSDEIAFRKKEGRGWYSKEITTLRYLRETGNVYFDIPLKYFEYKPFKAWTHRMG